MNDPLNAAMTTLLEANDVFVGTPVTVLTTLLLVLPIACGCIVMAAETSERDP